MKIMFLLSCFAVINVTKTLHAVFMLIISFTFGACICIFLEAYFVGFLFIIVYVGAVAVLFLFVLMLLDFSYSSDEFDNYEFKSSIYTYFVLLYFIFSYYFMNNLMFDTINSIEFANFSFLEFFVFQSNVFLIGQIMYTQYFVAVILVSLILFIAMVGAICLAYIDFYPAVQAYSQDLTEQILTDSSVRLFLKKPRYYNFNN